MNVTDITDKFKNLLGQLRQPAKIIPGILMVCGLMQKPGLSCLVSTSNIIESISKLGIPTEPSPDGTPNMMNQLVHNIVCEVIRALQEDANIQVSIVPGTLAVDPMTHFNITTGQGVAQIL